MCLRTFTTYLIPAAFLLVLSSACDNTIDPFTDSGSVPFALYGYLDTGLDTQCVRISPVRKDREPDAPASSPTQVTSTNLGTGDVVVWRDSVALLSDGSTALLYYAPFSPQPGAVYALEVRSEAGPPTRAFTSVPDGSVFERDTPRVDSLGFLRQRTVWRDLPQARQTWVEYRVRSASRGKDTTLAFQYVGSTGGGDWRVDVQLERDRRRMSFATASAFGDTLLILLGITMRIEAGSPEWDEPEAGANIENGLGFFGALGRFSESWLLEPDDAVRAGFRRP